MHGEILFNRQQYDLALADYKKLQAKATTAERRQLGAIGDVYKRQDIRDVVSTVRWIFPAGTAQGLEPDGCFLYIARLQIAGGKKMCIRDSPGRHTEEQKWMIIRSYYGIYPKKAKQV